MTIAELPPTPETLPAPEPAAEGEARQQGLAMICYSGDLEKTWAAMILASTAGAMGMPTKVFVTFWGLQTFVKPGIRITGENWMQKMMSMMSRPGIAHRKLSKMNFLGMGPWMMRKLAKQYNVASPAELMEMATLMGVEFVPCQMTMDMFGIKREDLLDGMGEPVGAATYLGYVAEGAAPIFI
ncbi:MAG TPA: DsrE/DsrF/DrsH-like family protein [Candidatus Limnocylindrales bacterium]|nr:DsrE/DsrF/DrsH-like family protein [Candidatus Limnocylindrales bacterium]